jgi:two-component system, cell cycle response regulator DivK
MQILVVDDEPDVRSTMKMLLESDGHRVDVAANGREAVEVATRDVPDVVVMDLNMPVMDGVSAARILRQHPRTQGVPVIALSAYLTQGDWRDKALSAGCRFCLPKPVDWPDLRALLARL